MIHTRHFLPILLEFLDNNSSCKLIFLENKVPTPIAKKNTKGKILYGVFPTPVKLGTNNINNIIPPIKTKAELAFEIPFLDARNKHTTTGNKNTTIKASYLNCVKMLADAEIILETSSDEVLSNSTKLPMISVVKIRTKPMTTNTKYDDSDKIFFLLGKSDNAIKGIVSGNNPRDNGCERIEGI